MLLPYLFKSHRHYKIPQATPSVWRLIHRDGKNLRFSTEIAVYLGNGAR